MTPSPITHLPASGCLKKTLGEKIRSIRLKQCLSQTAFTEKLVDFMRIAGEPSRQYDRTNYLSLIENGVNYPTNELLEALYLLTSDPMFREYKRPSRDEFLDSMGDLPQTLCMRILSDYLKNPNSHPIESAT